MIKERCNIIFGDVILLVTALVLCSANGIINSTILFVRSRKLSQGVRWHFWSCHTVDISASITWNWWHCQWNHVFHQVEMIKVRCNLTLFAMWCWHLHCVTLMASPIAPLHLLHQMIEGKDQHNLLVIWPCWHWHQHHIMPILISIVPMH